MKLAEIRARIAELEEELRSLRIDADIIEVEEADAHRDPEQPRIGQPDPPPGTGPTPFDGEPPPSMGWSPVEYGALQDEATMARMPLKTWLDKCLELGVAPTTRDQARLRQLAGWVGAWQQGSRE